MPYFGLTNRTSRSVPVVRAITPRNLIVATGEAKVLGLIKKIDISQSRNVIPRYELGQEEVSYLAPGAIVGDSNTIKIEKFLVFESTFLEYFGESYSQSALLNPNGAGGTAGQFQGKDGYPQALLDFNKPFDILIMRRGIMNLTGEESGGNIDLQRAGAGAGMKEAARQAYKGMMARTNIQAAREGGVAGVIDNSMEQTIGVAKDVVGFANPFTGGPIGALYRKGKEVKAGVEDLVATGRNAAAVVTGVKGNAGPPHPYNLIIYRAFRECWITDYKWSSDVGVNGEMAPIIEDVTIKYTFMEGHGSTLDDGGNDIGKKVEEVWNENFGKGT